MTISRRRPLDFPPARGIPDARVAVWAFVLLGLAAGCARSEASVRAEFDAFVAASNTCAAADECTVVAPGCPLGCQVAVRTDQKDAVSAKAQSLVKQYQAGGRSCDYDCIGPGQVVCEQSRCAIEYEISSPGVGGTGGGGPLPTAQLVMSPVDGTTAAGMDIALRLFDYAGIVDDAKLGEVAARAVLQTWPERVPVAFTTDTLAEAPPSVKMIRIVPTAPLEDRWYVVGVSSLPAKITTAAFVPPDAKPGARFRPGSHPRVRQIDFCAKEGAGMKLVVQLSEPVTPSRPAQELVTLQVAGAASPCVLYDTRPDALYFTCAALQVNASVVVTVASDAAVGGAALEGGSWAIDVLTLPAGSCRTFQTPL